MRFDEQPKILILTCNTGEGHNSAAKAIKAALAEKNISCEIKDVLAFKSERSSARISKVYNYAIKRVPKLFGLVYTLGGVYDNLRLPSPIYKANAKYADKLYAHIKENGYKCVVCTHLFAMQAMTAVRKQYCLLDCCYGVMTDYTIHPFIKDSDLDGYFVPSKTVERQFLRKGFSRDKIFRTGIPVLPKFGENISKREARTILNLPYDKKIAVIMTGGSGCGKITQLCKKLNKKFDDGHLFVVLTGNNECLKRKLDEMFKHSQKFRTVAFTDAVHLYLKAADCVLSKSGGLSSTEIAVANVPLIHLKAIPGLETANLKYFSNNGLSLCAKTVKRAAKLTRRILTDELCAEAVVKNQKRFIRSDATETIIEKLTEGISYDSVLLGNSYSRGLSYGEYDVLSDDPQTVEA